MMKYKEFGSWIEGVQNLKKKKKKKTISLLSILLLYVYIYIYISSIAYITFFYYLFFSEMTI